MAVLSSGLISLSFAVLFAAVYVLFEKAAVDAVSRPSAEDARAAQGYDPWEERWAAKKAHVALQQLGFDRSAARRLADPRLETVFDTASAVADLRVQAKRHGGQEEIDDFIAAYVRLQARAEVADAMRNLTRNRDILHDTLWWPHCWRPGRTRGCADDTTLRKYIAPQVPPVAFAAWESLLVLAAVFLAGSYDFAILAIATHVLSRAIRVAAFTSTTLGPLNPNCRLVFRGASESGGCGDLLFSGHGVVVASAICTTWTLRYPRIPWIVCVGVTLIGLHSMLASAVERFHYTADMVLALAVTVLVRSALAPYILKNPDQHGALPPPRKTLRLRHGFALAAGASGCLSLLWWLGVLGKP